MAIEHLILKYLGTSLDEEKLTSKARKSLPSSSFVYPKERKYPIHNISHARNALARVAQHGTSSQKAKVKSAVYKKYPSLKHN